MALNDMGVITASSLSAAASRYVGGTTSGAPNGSVAALAGDFVIDQTGAIWVCITAGTPGTWAPAGTQTDYNYGQTLASGESSTPRVGVGTGPALSSGNLYLTYWTALKTETCNNVWMVTNGVAAGATPTYAAMGAYSVATNGNLTLQGACASDTTLYAATYTTYERALTASFTKTAGQRYAFAFLVVTAAAMPTFYGYNGTLGLPGSTPRLCGAISSQSSLQSSYTAGQVSGYSSMHFGVISP